MSPLQTRIGAMRESLQIQSDAITTSTGTGFQTGTWTTFATIPGEYIDVLRGSGEVFAQGSVVAELAPVFRVRYRADIEPKHRILWRGLTLQIHAVIPAMRVGNRFLMLHTGFTQ